jgi:hypothetical protein
MDNLKNKKYKNYKNNNTDKYVKYIYNDIYDADKYIQKMNTKHNIQKEEITIDNISQIPQPDSFSSNFFPSDIKSHIMNKSHKLITYKATIHDRVITLYMTCSTDIMDENSKYDTYANKVFMWLSIAFQYSSKVCSETLDIYFYLTPYKKTLPSSELVVLDAKQVNTAWTYVCKKQGEIVLFREEEWFKVFIHETFHNLGLDFSNMNLQHLNTKLKKIFHIHSEMNSYEAYCDFWARILNSAFTSYFLLDNKNDFDEFKLYCDFCFQLERMFSVYQCVKVLHYMNIVYHQLYETDISNIYKENTNVFSYYVLTAILMNNYADFFSWCDKNNISLFKFKQTDRNLDLYYDYVNEHYKDDSFLKLIDYYTTQVIKHKKKNKNKKILETTRMSLIEYV